MLELTASTHRRGCAHTLQRGRAGTAPCARWHTQPGAAARATWEALSAQTACEGRHNDIHQRPACSAAFQARRVRGRSSPQRTERRSASTHAGRAGRRSAALARVSRPRAGRGLCCGWLRGDGRPRQGQPRAPARPRCAPGPCAPHTSRQGARRRASRWSRRPRGGSVPGGGSLPLPRSLSSARIFS